MALFAVVHCGFVLHVAQRAVSVVRSGVRIGLKLFSFLGHGSLRMALDAGVFIRIHGVLMNVGAKFLVIKKRSVNVPPALFVEGARGS